jgi:hypothetical protein
MQAKGYRYAESDEIDEGQLKRFKAIVGPGARPLATKLPDPSTSYDRAALAELQREEVRVVNADLECEQREITPAEARPGSSSDTTRIPPRSSIAPVPIRSCSASATRPSVPPGASPSWVRHRTGCSHPSSSTTRARSRRSSWACCWSTTRIVNYRTRLAEGEEARGVLLDLLEPREEWYAIDTGMRWKPD